MTIKKETIDQLLELYQKRVLRELGKAGKVSELCFELSEQACKDKFELFTFFSNFFFSFIHLEKKNVLDHKRKLYKALKALGFKIK